MAVSPQRRRRLPSMRELFASDGAVTETPTGPSGCRDHPDPASEIAACAASFRHFLRHWKFVNRETGQQLSFRTLWPGQERIAAKMEEHRQLIILKAGKLGMSELECAFDGWRLRFGGPNTRVHIFSKDALAAAQMLSLVKYGLLHLPDYMMRTFTLATDEAGGDTQKALAFRGGPDDRRVVISYAPTKNAAIDMTSQHTHVDELARMPHAEDTWASVNSTIAPGGTMHIVSRGQGGQNYMATLWYQAEEPESAMVQVFEPWDARPREPESEVLRARVERGELDAAAAWYAEQEAKMPTASQLFYFAPRAPEEALQGASEDAFVDISRWDACYDETLPSLLPGDPTPVVLSLDAGVTNDVFAATIISRHPDVPTRAALRGYRGWRAAEGREVDFEEVQQWIRTLCLGGCALGHPRQPPSKGGGPPDGRLCAAHEGKHYQHDRCDGAPLPCPACVESSYVDRLNVLQIVYDRYELRDMMQALTRDRVAWCEPMDQGEERTVADTALRSLIVQRDFAHAINPADFDNPVRQHFQGAKGRIPTGDDNRVRIEKSNPKAKVDFVVSISMGTARALYLRLDSRAQ